jgi:hypothetical protein
VSKQRLDAEPVAALNARDNSEQMRVAIESREADSGPRCEDQDRTGDGAGRGGAITARHDEPHYERPEDQLHRDQGSDEQGAHYSTVAVAPHEREPNGKGQHHIGGLNCRVRR